MFKQASVMFLYAETSVHLGGGESLGAIDLAIQRERHTDFPMGASSGIKGAVRAWFEKASQNGILKQEPAVKDKIERAFGQEQNSEYMGATSFSDARILLFPVRSLAGVFAYITCPIVLERFRRDLAVAGITANLPPISAQQGKALGMTTNENKMQNNKVVLEEFVFDFDGSKDGNVKNIADWLKSNAFPCGNEYQFWKNNFENHFLIVSDDDFRDFVKFSTEVQSRVKLGEGKSSDTSKGGNLFYQENLPSDSVMYSLVMTQDAFEKVKVDSTEWGTVQEIDAFIKHLDGKRLQIGGDESIGKGIMCVKFYSESSTAQGGEK